MSDLFDALRLALAASTTAPDAEIAAYYVASARVSFAKAVEELHTLETLLVERERMLAARARSTMPA